MTKFTSIRRIAVDAVMKRTSLTQPEDFEAITMRLVHDSTTIPVPRIRRSLTNQYCRAIVMDYIPGQTLTQCWSSLSIWRRLGIIWTLRQYIRQLRNVLVPGVPRDAQFPGPVSSEPQVAQGPMFTAYVSRKHHHLFADHVIATDFSRVIGVRSLSLVRRAHRVVYAHARGEQEDAQNAERGHYIRLVNATSPNTSRSSPAKPHCIPRRSFVGG